MLFEVLTQKLNANEDHSKIVELLKRSGPVYKLTKSTAIRSLRWVGEHPNCKRSEGQWVVFYGKKDKISKENGNYLNSHIIERIHDEDNRVD